MIIKEEVMITPFQKKRMLHIYLPDDYKESDERYPVMYMYDGHNLFYDEDATYGKSWGLKTFLDAYDKPFIIVGIECSHEGNERLNEFSPYSFQMRHWGQVEGKGKVFMDWVVYELKPYIDQTYRTMPFRECTGIGGSSMGGLMSLYTIMHYNEYFSKAACVSSAVYGCMPQLKEELKQSHINPDTRVYISVGSKEFSNPQEMHAGVACHEYFAKAFLEHHAYAYLNVIDQGMHSEASWEKENPVYFDFLWK